ncbi:hypothetical protein FsymDg_3371 [Candidatus Protofrankia datiscae]|uniref:Uncharacterized protein n=1 Tax=Candidatus Protofrankia datiscae TaxID=2716812 RepID=F8B0N8_9ACTN|nr:hypothetical protein FsymDg_3371 [Candidatus Protofrankia datiscae]
MILIADTVASMSLSASQDAVGLGLDPNRLSRLDDVRRAQRFRSLASFQMTCYMMQRNADLVPECYTR